MASPRSFGPLGSRPRYSALAALAVVIGTCGAIGPGQTGVAPAVAAQRAARTQAPEARPRVTGSAKARSRAAQERADQPGDSSLIRVAYRLVDDSGGGHPNKGAEVDLLFASGGEAFLYLADATEALGEEGTYAYGAGQLSLHISSSDFMVDATFPLNLTGSQATMPFKVFSSGKGTSLWDREALDLGPGIQAVHNASINASNLSLTPAQAAQSASAYGEAWLSVPANPPPAMLQRSASGKIPDARPPLGKCTEDGDNCITSVQNAGDDVLIHYRDAPPSLVMLYSSGARAAGARLGTSALAGDPRVYLDPEKHPDSKFDPSHRTAVIIDPEPSLEQPGALANMVSTLKKRDYEVTELDGTQASIERIAGAL